jgi:hypothetical protein
MGVCCSCESLSTDASQAHLARIRRQSSRNVPVKGAVSPGTATKADLSTDGGTTTASNTSTPNWPSVRLAPNYCEEMQTYEAPSHIVQRSNYRLEQSAAFPLSPQHPQGSNPLTSPIQDAEMRTDLGAETPPAPAVRADDGFVQTKVGVGAPPAMLQMLPQSFALRIADEMSLDATQMSAASPGAFSATAAPTSNALQRSGAVRGHHTVAGVQTADRSQSAQAQLECCTATQSWVQSRMSTEHQIAAELLLDMSDAFSDGP